VKHTRCPDCGTLFRVSDEQLAARQGMVRCGRCRAAFDALDHLLPPRPEDAPATGETAALPPPAAPAVPPPPDRPAREFVAAAAAEPGDDAATRDVSAAAHPAEGGTGPAAQGEALDDAAHVDVSPVEAGDRAEPPPMSFAPDRSAVSAPAEPGGRARLRGRLTQFAVAALLVLALLQSAWVFHDPLAHAVPAARPVLAGLCELVGCRIELPREVALIDVQAEVLSPPERRGQLVLRASLRNTARFMQAYPHLELQLTDYRDRPVGRRVFAPAEYLPPEVAAGGFAAESEQAVHLVIEAADLPASGYRVDLFYP
jgi:predicted Zn finger-like uncharacterized protein